jgi:hypothetical protein
MPANVSLHQTKGSRKEINRLNENSPNLEKLNPDASNLSPLSQNPHGEMAKENASRAVRNSGLIKPGPLPSLPPSLKEWKASGKRGLPPLAYQAVIRDAPNNALEYELYHGFKGQVSPFEIEQRIQELEKGYKSQDQRYTRAAIYYLQKKLEELVVGGSVEINPEENNS